MLVLIDVLAQKDVLDISPAQSVTFLREQILFKFFLLTTDHIRPIFIKVFDNIVGALLILTFKLAALWRIQLRQTDLVEIRNGGTIQI